MAGTQKIIKTLLLLSVVIVCVSFAYRVLFRVSSHHYQQQQQQQQRLRSGDWTVDKVGSIATHPENNDFLGRNRQEMCVVQSMLAKKASEINATTNNIFHKAAKRMADTNKVTAKIDVFWHMGAFKKNTKRFHQIVTRQHDLLHSSGLWKAAFKIHIGIVGDAEIPSYIRKNITQSSHVNIFAHVPFGDESVTTTYMRELCRLRQWASNQNIQHNSEEHHNGMVLYFHSRGLSHPFDHPTHQWTYAMEYFVIKQWRAASSIILSGADTAGCAKFLISCMLHYSGNFFWASVDYIASLPDPNKDNDVSLHKYTSGELWLLAQDPQPENTIHFALHNPSESLSTRWSVEYYEHYDHRYEFTSYSCMDVQEPNMPSRVRCV